MPAMRRREMLLSMAAAGLSRPAFAASAGKVRDLEIFTVKVNHRGNWVLVRMRTDQGLTGIGDASHGGGDQRVIELMRSFFGRLQGRSVRDIERFRAECQPEIRQRGRAAVVAFSGLEQCLWDIQGRAAGVPVYDLMGGALRTRIRNYANINRSTVDRSPSGFARMAEAAIRAGFDAIKMAPWDDMPRSGTEPVKSKEITELGIARTAAVRKAIGASNDLLLDAHSHFNLEDGLELARRLEEYNLFWLEEVTPPRPLENLARINQTAKMPTAGGESIYGVAGFYPYIAAGCVDIAMPDVKYCGGVLELKKIASMAEGAGLPTSPHGPASPIGNMAAAHVCATMPNFQILEFAFGETTWRHELIDPPEQIEKGILTVSSRPGFGVELNDKAVAAHSAV
jgi:galactonate dehydratase